MASRKIILVLYVFQVRNSVPDDTCDQTMTWVPEGNQGQAGTFPWLGVIRVHLHEGAKLRIAVTGSVLVKATHALANADDIAKIPKKIFKHDSKAMFIPYGNQPWLCHLKDYLLHPEYEYGIVNTIALIELEPVEKKQMPMQPLCWPSYLYNTSNQLYALGYTDEKGFLEKVVHKVQYIDRTLCEGYYNRAGVTGQRNTPSPYLCGLAGSDTKDCDWDNGMVLASNCSGPWVLIGFGIRGPGCSAPSRFIEMFQYLPWIETSTSKVQSADSSNSYRKSAFGTGFKKQIVQKQRMEDIPVHQFFRSGNRTYGDMEPWWRTGPEGDTKNSIKWFDSVYEDVFWKQYDIERIDKDAIVVSKFRNKFEKSAGDCLKANKYLCYAETMKIHADDRLRGLVTYKLAIMDLLAGDYTCVTIRIKAERSTETELWYKTTMDVDESIDKFDRTPDFLIKKYPIPEYVKKGRHQKKWPDVNLQPRLHVDETQSWLNKRNVNLYLKFKFVEKAYLILQIWGPLATTTKPTPTTVTAPNTSTVMTTPNLRGYTFRTVRLRSITTPKYEIPWYLKLFFGENKNTTNTTEDPSVNSIETTTYNPYVIKLGTEKPEVNDMKDGKVTVADVEVVEAEEAEVEEAEVEEVTQTPSGGARMRPAALTIAVAVYLVV